MSISHDLATIYARILRSKGKVMRLPGLFQQAAAIYETPQASHSYFLPHKRRAWEEVSWLNVRFAPDNLVTP